MAKKAAKKKPAKAAGTSKEKTAKKGKPVEKLGNPEKTFNVIEDLVKVMKEDLDKLLGGGVKAAGRRVRSSAQQIRKSCALMRKEVQAVVNELKTK